MATINITGFETRDLLEASTTAGAISVQNTVARNSGYALYLSSGAVSSPCYYKIQGIDANGVTTPASVATSYIRFYFRVASFGAGSPDYFFLLRNSSDQIKLGLYIDFMANVYVTSAVTSYGPSAISLSTNTWYRVNVVCGTGTSAPFSVHIDGVEQFNVSNANLTASNATHVLLGTPGIQDAVNYYFDDFRWSNSAAPGAGRCVALFPAANGTQMTAGTANGAASAWQCVDEAPNDGDTTYVNGVTSPSRYTAAVDASSIAGVGNAAVKGCLISKLNSSGSPDSQPKLYLYSPAPADLELSGSTGGSISYDFRAILRDTIDSVAWNMTNLANLEMGWREDGTHTLRATAIYVMVDYEDPPPVATAQRRQYHQVEPLAPSLRHW